jgi:polysaccharide export outer membrane protein
MISTRIVTGLAAVFLCLCAGCAYTPGGFIDTDNLKEPPKPATPPAQVDVQPIDARYFMRVDARAVPPETCPLTCLTPATRARYEYRIGVGDLLQVIVWDHPELTGGFGSASGAVPPLPAPSTGVGNAAGTTAAAAAGIASVTTGDTGSSQPGSLTVRVAGDGTIFFPRVGRIRVLDKTAEQVQRMLTQGLAKTIVHPEIDVRISGFNSQQIQVLGDVRAPQAQAITETPLSIVDALNRAGGALADADLQNVGVTRNGKRYRVDVASLLDSGNVQQNVLLQDGDIVDVPDRTDSRVFVLGEVTHPAIVPMNRGKLTLADAIASTGGLNALTANPRVIYVIRGVDPQPGANHRILTKLATPEVFRLDMTQADALMLMTQFELKARDVVYVQIAGSARFNRLLDLITPTLQSLFFTQQLVR